MLKALAALFALCSLTACSGLQHVLRATNNNVEEIKCSGGARLIAGGCYCPGGTNWNGLNCQGTPGHGDCLGNSYPFGPAGQNACLCATGSTLNGDQCIALQCSGGAVPGDDQCVCPGGTNWDGNQCVAPQALQCSGGAVIQGDGCVCLNGSLWDGNNCIFPPAAPQSQAPSQDSSQISCSGGAYSDGNQCVCPDGTVWDGNNCSPPQGAPERRTCRSVMIEKNFDPSSWHMCEAVNSRCAVMLLDKGYDPHLLHMCSNVDGACAEEILQKNYDPVLLKKCSRDPRKR